jgi:hypothetical protein
MFFADFKEALLLLGHGWLLTSCFHGIPGGKRAWSAL